MRNIAVNKGHVHSRFDTLVAPHIVISDPRDTVEKWVKMAHNDQIQI